MKSRSLIFASLCFCLLIPSAYAKKKKEKVESKTPQIVAEQPLQNPRLAQLSSDNLAMFNALSKDQQDNIRQQKVETGYNAWMTELALGTPYYKSEHHPEFVDYEQVWLYTADDVTQTIQENDIIDPVNQWPSLHRFTTTKTCKIGDKFVLFDRGVIAKITPDSSKKTYGSCIITTSEEFIPKTPSVDVVPQKN